MSNEELASQLSAINEKLKTIFNEIEEVKKTLNGNGQPGMVEKVAKLEERMNGTWKTMLILGWTANFLIAAGALAAAILLK